jgi:hypothetical protein
MLSYSTWPDFPDQPAEVWRIKHHPPSPNPAGALAAKPEGHDA